MKNNKTSFKSIAWLLSIAMLLAWLAGMGFITYKQAEKYRQQMLKVGTSYAGQFVDHPILPCYQDFQLRPDAYEDIEHLLMSVIGDFSGDMSHREYLLPGQKVPADTAVIVYDSDGNEYLHSTDFMYILYTNQENWEQGIQPTDGNLWLDLGDDPALYEAVMQIQDARDGNFWFTTISVTGSVDGAKIIPSKLSYTTEQNPWRDDAQWQTVLDRAPASDGQEITVYAHYGWVCFASDVDDIAYQGERYESLTDLLRARDSKKHTYGNLLRLYVFSRDYLWGWEDNHETVAYKVETVVACSPVLIAMHTLSSAYIVTFALFLMVTLILLRIIHRNLTRPLFVLNAHMAGRRWYSLKKESKWREPLELEQRFTELTDTIKTQNDELRRKENEINRLNQALDYAKQAEENRRSMISAVAHELKTPLAVIHGYTEGLQENIAEEKKDQYLATILSESERMDKLVMEMLDLSRLEAGKVKLARDTFSLTELIQSVFDRLSRETEKKSLHLTFDLHCEGQIYADEGRMEQVILNLASNAVRYTPAGGHIRVRTEKKVGMVFLYMENDAAPFAKEELTKVWETFYRTDRARNGKGTGLGLAIVKNIIKLHGGTCYARNTQSGVEFSFHIPQI